VPIGGFKFYLDSRNNGALPLDPACTEHLSVCSPAVLPWWLFTLFQTSPIKLNMGLQMGVRLLIAKHLDQNHYDWPIRNMDRQSNHISYTLSCRCESISTNTHCVSLDWEPWTRFISQIQWNPVESSESTGKP
jgi:hypothetical protein